MKVLDALRRRRYVRRLAGHRLLRGFAAVYPEAVFAEIGANDGAQHDHLRPFVLEGRWRGVMVEPVPYVFERLRANYASVADRVACEHAAVDAVSGTREFFHLAQAEPAERAGLPSFYDGIGSFSRAAVLSHRGHIPDIDERLRSTAVRTRTLAEVLERHGLGRLDLLAIDTEGHDAAVLASVDLVAIAPRLIVYEHYHLDRDDRAACEARLRAHGYELLSEGFDTFALHARPDALTRMFRRLRPALPDATADATLHDTSTPLPPGAEVDLRDDHPRLAELRTAFATVGLPASRWDAERVGVFLDLRHFRGESLITWHYREGRRLTELKYYALLRAVRDQDALGLLDRLTEDGAFGCWSYDLPGYGRVSRDLLESVAELNAIGPPPPRVLDIGAGYGRLAHRMAEAFPGALEDYCCTDAVPESAFVCEYYLRHRGVAPPARTVGVHEIGALATGSFDLAVNVHAFSECPRAAVEWWLRELARLEVPRIFAVPNEPEGFRSTEPDGRRDDLLPAFAGHGYALVREQPAIADPAVRALLGLHDRHLWFERQGP